MRRSKPRDLELKIFDLTLLLRDALRQIGFREPGLSRKYPRDNYDEDD